MLAFSSVSLPFTVFHRCTVHLDIYKVHTPSNAVLIKIDKFFKIYIKNHFDLLLHISVFKEDHHQEAFIRAYRA